MESLQSVMLTTSFCALIRLDITVKASNSFPISDHDTTLFSRLLLGVSLLRKAEFLPCPEVIPLLKNEAASISDNENQLKILLETVQCTNLCVKMS